ncbi:MAG: CDP-alcohol phosphatidyltransferase family protein [Tistlia sp.]|uniref:CDP-alcohol phosphatidyltransferase family protein n=1 Tax=Tistlia sp. TaxID=3057121 RepID=UPI0034A535EE
MKSGTTLVILPGDAGGAPGIGPELELLGLPLVRRNVLSAARAGIERVVVVTGTPEALAVPLEGTLAALRTPEEFSLPEGRVILLAGHVLADSAWLRGLCTRPLARGAILLDEGPAALLEGTDLPARLLARDCWRPGEGAFAALGEARTGTLDPEPTGRFVLQRSTDLEPARKWLLERLIKSGDSALTRRVSRPISLAISRRLAPTRITPNQVTVVSILIGLAGTPFFLSLSPFWQTAGALLLLVHNIVDGCDGELARLKFQSSHRGMILDLWGDNLVHAALFSCMGLGWSLGIEAVWPLGLAVLAVAGTLVTAWLVYRQTLRTTLAGTAPQFSSVAQDRETRLARFMSALGNRDFLYGIFLLSLFGKAHWLLPLVAAGSPLFALGLVVLSRRSAPTA